MDGRNYTLDDIEALRSKTGISYEEAVGLLEKYDGDIARALIELEKRGQLGGARTPFGSVKIDGSVAEFFSKWWKKGYHTRVIVERNGRQLIDLSVLFLILALVLGARLLVAAAALALILGCHVRVRTDEPEEQTVPAGDAEKTETPGEPGETVAEKEEDGFHTITIE